MNQSTIQTDRMPLRSIIRDLGLALGLITVGSTLRLQFVDLPNFAPVAAIALFAGIWLRSRWLACLVPLSVMLTSDWVLDRGYEWGLMLVVYGSLAAPAFLGRWIRRWNCSRTSAWRASTCFAGSCLGSSLFGSVFFFSTTNFAVWWTYPIYERSWTGLLECYTAALPFFRYTLLGDLFFLGSLLVVHFAAIRVREWLEQRQPRESSLPASGSELQASGSR